MDRVAFEKQPYLSFAITSRNDDHGGNTLRRMQVSLIGLLEQLEKYRIESELVLVDWNPPADKLPLKDAIKWPESLKYSTIRVIVVPPSIHQRYKYADKIPMNVVVAVNCGIRRARGQFMLEGAIDLLYSNELMSYIAAKTLKEDERYRVDRYDVARNVLQYDTLKDQLDFCQQNIIQINSHRPSSPKGNLPDLHLQACGDFQLMSRRYWHLLRGYREADIIGSHADSLLSYASYAAGVREVVLNNPMRIYHIDHDDKFNERREEARLPLENWLALPFLPAGVNNRLIAWYRRFVMLMGYRAKASVRGGVPTLSFAEFLKISRDIVAGKCSYIFNDENWGLGQESLAEFIINTAEWDRDNERN